MRQRRPTTADPTQLFDPQLTFGQRVADRVAGFGGSWTFIGLFVLGLVGWMVVQGELNLSWSRKCHGWASGE
jgi:uncharacterized membrane protein